MIYYVVSDVHGFYTELRTALEEQGFFKDTEPHKLIICGDLFDRGKEAVQLQDFVLDLMGKDEIILIRGNHEDLTEELIEHASRYYSDEWTVILSHHAHNGTVSTLEQLTGIPISKAIADTQAFVRKAKETPFIKTILPKMVDYYETKKYVFVHGWIPTTVDGKYYASWRTANKHKWDAARWENGIRLAVEKKVLVPRKTIVCGHWSTSFGHHKYGNAPAAYTDGADFSPFERDGIIALDACTPISRKINCIILKDEPRS